MLFLGVIKPAFSWPWGWNSNHSPQGATFMDALIRERIMELRRRGHSYTEKLIQSLGKSIYADRWKIRKNMSSSLVLLTSKDHSCAGKLNKLPISRETRE